MADWVDFRAVKDAVTIEMILGHYAIELRQTNRDSLRGDCPLPTHSGDATENSFAVNTQKNAWACQSSSCVANRDGRKGGNVLDFVAVMESCTIRDAALKLQNWFSVQASNERPEGYVRAKDRLKGQKLAAEKKEGHDPAPTCTTDTMAHSANEPLEFELKSIDASHEYFRRRGIKEETARHFGAGFFFGRGSMSERVVIPVHNEKGELIAYAGRAIDDDTAKQEGKYKVPAGFKKSLVLFNLHRAIEHESREVVIVEGYFDSLKVHQAGFPSVVALMGCELSDHQEQLLVEHFDSVVIMLDGDEGGRAANSQIVLRLMRKIYVRTVDAPDATQPDRLSSQELQKLLAFLR